MSETRAEIGTGGEAATELAGGAVDFTAAEVKQLHAFHDGSIMCVDVRHHLWRSWGFCPRHTWASAVIEPELRWNLHGTVILYEDLMGRAVVALRKPAATPTMVRRRLRARAGCFTCDFVALAHDHTDPSLEAVTAKVNKRTRFTAMLEATRPVWGPRLPAVSGRVGSGVPPSPTGRRGDS
jgi:hypothetical protein